MDFNFSSISLSELRVTSLIGFQFRAFHDQRSGCFFGQQRKPELFWQEHPCPALYPHIVSIFNVVRFKPNILYLTKNVSQTLNPKEALKKWHFASP